MEKLTLERTVGGDPEKVLASRSIAICIHSAGHSPTDPCPKDPLLSHTPRTP